MKTATVEQGRDWKVLVEGVRSGDREAMEQFYEAVSLGIRFRLRRAIGPQDTDDRVHEVFIDVIEAIRRDRVRDPENIIAYVQGVARHVIASHIDRAMRERARLPRLYTDNQSDHVLWGPKTEYELPDNSISQEEAVARTEERNIALRAIRALPSRYREALVRNLNGQPKELACAEMGLELKQYNWLIYKATQRVARVSMDILARRAKPAA